MISFKKTTNIDGKFKNFRVSEGKFIDNESDSEVDVAAMIYDAIADELFDIKVCVKNEEDIW